MSEEPPPPPYHQPWPLLPAGDRPGDLGTRFLAKLIDGVLVAVALTVTSAVLGLAAFGMGMRSGYGTSSLGTLISTAIVVGYHAYMESTRGQTVGKMLLRLRVHNLEGQHPSVEQALKRNAYLAIPLIGILPLVGGLITGLASLAAVAYVAVTITDDAPMRRGWHDRFGGTRVVAAGRGRP